NDVAHDDFVDRVFRNTRLFECAFDCCRTQFWRRSFGKRAAKSADGGSGRACDYDGLFEHIPILATRGKCVKSPRNRPIFDYLFDECGASIGLDCGEPSCRRKMLSTTKLKIPKNSLCQFWND